MLSGKGFFVWPLIDVRELAGPQADADALVDAGFSHVIFRYADGAYTDGVRGNHDYVREYADACRTAGLVVVGYQAPYLNYPEAEARIGVERFHEIGFDLLVIDAEGQCKGKHAAARRYMQLMRSGLPDVPFALSSYRWPSLHPELPWDELVGPCQIVMPQVYWEKGHNPVAQLRRSVSEYRQRWPNKQYFPTGAAYQWDGWRPTLQELQEFFVECQQTPNVAGCNFWEYGHSKRYGLWATLAALSWEHIQEPGEPPAPVVTTATIANTRSDRVNLRSAPFADSATAIGQLYNGTQCEVLETVEQPNETWLRVRVEGWVAKDYHGQNLVRLP